MRSSTSIISSNPKHHMEDITESFTLSILCVAGPQSNMPVPWNMAWFHSASSHILITFPSCSSDPDFARLQTGKNNVERCFSSACTNTPGCAETVPAPNAPAGCCNADFSNILGFIQTLSKIHILRQEKWNKSCACKSLRRGEQPSFLHHVSHHKGQ